MLSSDGYYCPLFSNQSRAVFVPVVGTLISVRESACRYIDVGLLRRLRSVLGRELEDGVF